MSSQRYERISTNDEDPSPIRSQRHTEDPIPASPPPSFRSRTSSPTSQLLLSRHDPLSTDAERTLADTFDAPSDDEASDGEADNGGDDRQRLIHGTRPNQANQADRTHTSVSEDGGRPMVVQRRVTQLPVFTPSTTDNGTTGRVYGGGSRSANDGVFANLSAKPERGEKTEEQPPTYEQAAADATPPYWETTILAPGMVSDEVFVDGLPVGSLFSFIWNGMISMSFQLVGFLLTYLLHTTHAAKNGSRAGLGITFVQYGFYMKGSSSSGGGAGAGGEPQYGQPPDPNSHDFNPSAISSDSATAAVAAMVDSQAANETPASSGGLSSIASSEWLAYTLMIAGWFILIRAVSDFLKARRHEQLVLQSPDRGLGVPVVASGEQSETVV
ncbi:MAG: hypothetical protein M1835_000583 [Candelina submexicana]|nr:MAG: hypothetical protein M1835_000583 [Candelina submexicana]